MKHIIVDGIIPLNVPTAIESEILGSRGPDLGWLMRDVAGQFRDGALCEYQLEPRVAVAACTGKPCIHLGYQTIPNSHFELALSSECVDRNDLTGETAKSACGRALFQLAAILDDPPRTNEYYVRFDTMTNSSEVLISEILDVPTLGQYANAETTSGRPVNPSDWATRGRTYRIDVGATKMPRAAAIPYTAPTLCCGDKVAFDTESNSVLRYHETLFDGDEISRSTDGTHSALETWCVHFVVVGTATVLNGDLLDGPALAPTSRGAIFQYGNNLYILERRAEVDTHR